MQLSEQQRAVVNPSAWVERRFQHLLLSWPVARCSSEMPSAIEQPSSPFQILVSIEYSCLIAIDHELAKKLKIDAVKHTSECQRAKREGG